MSADFQLESKPARSALRGAAPAWQGTLGPETAELYGTVGLRTDNVRLDCQLLVGGGRQAPCRACPSGSATSACPQTRATDGAAVPCETLAWRET
ncbi:MAG TPA: hypothetical protein VMW75_20790 [Thermoanaerobaculia bacterium]|nr:hypothetical protein [Thermoanaerobaculia bacterium]